MAQRNSTLQGIETNDVAFKMFGYGDLEGCVTQERERERDRWGTYTKKQKEEKDYIFLLNTRKNHTGRFKMYSTP